MRLGLQGLTPEQQRLLPSSDDVAFYKEHGWYVSPNVVPHELIDDAMIGIERHFAGERDIALPLGGYEDWKPADGDGLRNCEHLALQNYRIRRLVGYPMIGAIAAKLTGSSAIRLFEDQLLYKPPSTPTNRNVVGWHVDRAYYMTCSSQEMLTAWLPFHDCHEEMGPLMVVDKSHTWPIDLSMRTFEGQDLQELERWYGNARDFVSVPMTLAKGQISFHHCMTIHGSDGNRSSLPRVALAIHLQDESNRFRPYATPGGAAWKVFTHRVCRRDSEGNPDYADPSIFPVLWSE